MGEKTDVRRNARHRSRCQSGSRATIRALATAIIVAALVVGSGCQTPYESGLANYAEGRYSEAEEHVKEGLEHHPDDPQLNLLMAQILTAREEYRQAEPYAKRAFDSGRLAVEAGRTLGKIHWELGHPQKAASAWRAARQAEAKSVRDTDYQRALEAAIATTMNLQQFEAALELRRELKELDADHPEVSDEAFRRNREGLAATLRRDGELEEAVEIFRGLTEDYPERPRYALSSGRLLLQLGRHDEAITSLEYYVQTGDDADQVTRNLEVARRAERLDAPRVAIHFYGYALEAMSAQVSFRRAKLNLTLAALLFERGDEQKGREHIDRYLNDMTELRGLPLDAEVYMTAADTAHAHQQQAYALELLESGLENAPASWNLAEKLASRYARRARRPEMERVLETYLERENDSHYAQLRVARWALRRRNHELAQHFFERAVQHSEALARTWLELAHVYSSVGQVDKLQHTLETYVKRFDQERRELLEVASMYRDHRLYEEAEAVLEMAHHDDPESLVVIDRLADLYTDWGKPSKLHDYYKSWIEARGSKAEDFQLVGERFGRRGQHSEGLPYLEKAAEMGAHHAWLQIARIYSRQRRDRAMKEALSNYRKHAPQTAATYRSLLSRYRSAGMTHEAINMLEELIELEPAVISNYQDLTEMYFSQGRDREITEMWLQYLERSDRPMNALETVADWLERRGHIQPLLNLYGRLLDSEDADPRLYRLVGDTYLSLSKRRSRRAYRGRLPSDSEQNQPRERARRYYDKYLDQASPSRTELLDFADSMRSQGMWDVAASIYEKLSKGEADGSQIWFNYAVVLLRIGHVERAEALLERYFVARNKSVADARSIAGALFAAGRYRAAEPYYLRMFESEKVNHSNAAFRSLAQLYRATERPEKIPELIDAYLEDAQNPASARQEVLQQLADAGMYEEAADQIERIRAFQGEVRGSELAVNRYRAGQDDKAWKAFSEWAGQHAYPGDAWEEVGNFYVGAAEPDRARQAFENGLDVEPNNARVHMALAALLLHQGEVEAAQEALERARENVAAAARSQLAHFEVEAFIGIGRYDLAREAAERSVDSAPAHQQHYLWRIMAVYDLATQDPARIKRTAQEIIGSNMSLDDKVDLLETAGFDEEAAKLIEDELASGDRYAAGKVVLDQADLLTGLGGFDRLERAIQPLLEQSQNATTRAQLGEYLVSQGEYQRGIPYLRAAIGQGQSQFRPSLAHAYASLGFHDQAMRVLQKHLESGHADRLDVRLEQVARHFELRGERTKFMRLLRVLTADPRYRHRAAPLLAEFLAEAGRLEEAVSMLYESISGSNNAEAQSRFILIDDAESKDISTLVGTLEAVAGEGYVEESRRLIERLPDELQGHKQVRDLDLRLAATSAPDEAAELAHRQVEALGASKEDHERRLEIAELMLQHGAYEVADDIAAGGLTNMSPTVAAQTAEFLVENAFAAHDMARMDEVAAAHLERSDDTLDAKSHLATIFYNLGFDLRAARNAAAVADAVPTARHARAAVDRAHASGDEAKLARAIERFVRVDKNAVESLAAITTRHARHQEPELTELMLAPQKRVRPAAWTTRFAEIEMNFRSGEVERAREQLEALLEFVQWDAYAVQQVLARLYSAGLHVESARFVGPLLEERSISRRSRLYLGTAFRELGLVDEAREHFDAFVEASPDIATAASIVAGEMNERGFAELAREYAERAVRESPERETARFQRGIARLRLGEVEAAQRDLRLSIGSGMDRIVGLQQATYAALQAGEDAVAEGLLAELLTSPSPRDPDLPFRAAVDRLVAADRADLGVRFFEERFPDIANGDGVTGRRLVQSMSQLYESAGEHQRAYEVYDEAIAGLLVREPSDISRRFDQTRYSTNAETLAGYMNNLAYVYSTTNRHLGRGSDLVRRAIARTGARRGDYLDTLGWLYYRRGELETAEQLIGGAIRTRRLPAGIGELVDHMAKIRREQGRHDEANWLEIQLQAYQ